MGLFNKIKNMFKGDTPKEEHIIKNDEFHPQNILSLVNKYEIVELEEFLDVD